MADPFLIQVAAGALGDLVATVTALFPSLYGKDVARRAWEDLVAEWKSDLIKHNQTATLLRDFLNLPLLKSALAKVRDNRLGEVSVENLETALQLHYKTERVPMPPQAGRQLRRWWRKLEERVQPDAIRDHRLLRLRYLEAVYEQNSKIEFTGLVDASGKKAARMDELFVLPRFQSLDRRDEEPIKADRILVNAASPPRVILLGKPGAGKTTLLKCLAFTAAAHALEPHTRVEIPADLAWGRGLAGQLPVFYRIRRLVEDQLAAPSLWDCLYRHAGSTLQLALPAGFFEREADLSGLLLLFDGLDEGGAPAARNALAGCIETFAARLPEACTVIVSSRPHDYSHEFPKLAHYDLCDLDDEEIAAIIEKSGPFYESDKAVAVERAERLLAAVKDDSRKYLHEMAGTALLLAMIVRVHFITGSLPDTRRELYAKCVDTLLAHWSAELGPSPISVPLKEKFLRQLAFDMQKEAGGRFAEGKDSLRILKTDLEDRLQVFLQKESPAEVNQVEEVVRRLHERDAILVYDAEPRRGSAAFRFVHRTFQEYLAGWYMAKQLREREFDALVDENPPGWNETLYLAIASIESDPRREDLLLRLLKENRIEFANEAVKASRGVDAWLDLLTRFLVRYYTWTAEGGPEVGKVAEVCRGRKEVREVIECLFARDKRDARSLASAVELLEAMEKDSPVLKAFFEESKQQGLDTTEKMAWCDGFWMDKYLVTNRDFECMIPGRGQKRDEYSDQDLQPVIYVNWWEASLFCRWRGPGFRLPTEDEWYKAASWDAKTGRNRKYPWGDEWDAAKANTREKGPRRTTPVGAYPAGVSAYGCFDMAGNVWEWTSDPGRVRGGSWSNDQGSAVSSIRNDHYPGGLSDDLGFRCSRT